MIESLKYAKIGLSFIKLVRDPYRTEEIFKMAKVAAGAKDQSGVQAILARAMTVPAFAEQCRQRYCAPEYSIEALKNYPIGTLGREYAEHMLKYGFKPDFYPSMEVHSDCDYLRLRLRQVHDILHVVTGFDASVLGELALQGYSMGQLNDGISGLIIAAGILNSLIVDPTQIGVTMNAIVKGYELGKSTKLHVGMKWEQDWDVSLADLREEMGIGPVQSALNSKFVG